jgi:hypothetical protein
MSSVIKRKILLEDSIDRSSKDPKKWGTLTATTFYVKILLTQNIDDMGMFTDIDYIVKDKAATPVDYTILEDKLIDLGLKFPFMTGATNPTFNTINTPQNLWSVLRYPSNKEFNYYNFVDLVITATTDSRIEDVRSYSAIDPFRTNFDVNAETYENYEGFSINGVDRIKSMGEPKIYVFDTPNDIKLGTDSQVNGLQFKDYSATTKSTVRYIGEGFNKTNISLSALTKEEYLIGIISPPEVQNDVFIDRGITSVMDMHLRLSEIKNLNELQSYGNGYYKINKQ